MGNQKGIINVEQLQNTVNQLSLKLVDVIKDQAQKSVGIRNLSYGDKYFNTVDGHRKKLAGKGRHGDHIIIDEKTWRFMLANDDSVKMGFTIRDDSILGDEHIPAEPDQWISPNMVLDEEILEYPTMKARVLEDRIKQIDNVHVLHRIFDELDSMDPRPLQAIDIVDRRIKIVEYSLPSNFFGMNMPQLRELAKERGISELSEDIKSASQLREEIIVFLAEA